MNSRTAAPRPRKPHVTCHMMSSVDGRILSARWGLANAPQLFEKTAAQIKADAWIVGRTTMQEFAASPAGARRQGRFVVPKKDFIAAHGSRSFAVAIDPSGKCRWKSNKLDTEHVIEVLTEKVSAEYLDHLRSHEVSYIFGGRRVLDLALVLDKLRRLFPIRKVRIDGGGRVNGSFLAAGLIDEFSHVVVPVLDGTIGSPAIFDVAAGLAQPRADKARLISVKRLPNSVLWLRYKMTNRTT